MPEFLLWLGICSPRLPIVLSVVWFPEKYSEMGICLQEVYWAVSLGTTWSEIKEAGWGREGKGTIRQVCLEPQPIPQRALEPGWPCRFPWNKEFLEPLYLHTDQLLDWAGPGEGCKCFCQKGKVAGFKVGNSQQHPMFLAAGGSWGNECLDSGWHTVASTGPYWRKFESASGTWLDSNQKRKLKTENQCFSFRVGETARWPNWLEIWSQTDLGFHSGYSTLGVSSGQSLSDSFSKRQLFYL